MVKIINRNRTRERFFISSNEYITLNPGESIELESNDYDKFKSLVPYGFIIKVINDTADKIHKTEGADIINNVVNSEKVVNDEDGVESTEDDTHATSLSFEEFINSLNKDDLKTVMNNLNIQCSYRNESKIKEHILSSVSDIEIDDYAKLLSKE
jgi:hypothetical protein